MKRNYFDNSNIQPTTNRNHFFSILFFLIFSTVVFGQTTQTFNANGTFVVPAGVTSITVQAWGGGGSSGDNDRGAGGGGGGAYTSGTIAVTPGQTLTVTVGVGGIYSASNTATDDGGNSSVGVIVANGGIRGNHNGHEGGAGGAASTNPGGVTGFVSYSGGDGGDGRDNNNGGGGGGGASASASGSGGDGGNATGANGGSGGVSPGTGGGNGGRGSDNDSSPDSQNGSAPGGGGGGRADDDGTNRNGGSGRVILTWTCPTTAGTLSGNQYICRYGTTTTTLSSTISGGTWSSSNAAIATVNPTTGLVTSTKPDDGVSRTVTITYSVGGSGCPVVTATRDVYVANGPGGGVTSMSGSNSVCQGNTATYTIVSSAANSSHTWSFSGTGVTFVVSADTRSAVATFASNATSGNVVVNSINACGSGYGNGMYVTVGAMPTAGTISGTTTVCVGASQPNVTFSNPQNFGVRINYNINGGATQSIYVNANTSSNLGVSTGTTGTFTYNLVSIENGVGSPSCFSPISGSATITVSNPSVAPTGITGTNTICNGASTTLTLTGGTAGSGTARWYSGSCGGTLVGSGNSITVSPTSTTTYYVRYEGGCGTTSCASRTVTVNNFVTAANAGPDQSLVNGTSFTLAANTPTVGTGAWIIVSGPSTSLSQFSNTASPMATFTPVITGTYVLSWTISNSCSSSSDQVVIANNCVTNLITNGDFSGGTSGWTNATTQGTYVEAYSEDVYFNNGNSSLTAELDSEASLRQVLTVIPGVSYTVSFRYARRPTTGTPATTGVTVKVTGGTSDIISTAFTTTTTTAQIATFTFTPTSATIGLEFYNTLHGGITLGTIIDDIVLLPASQAAPVAVTNPKGVFNTSTSCAGVAVSLDVENVPASGVSYSWTGSAGTVFSATNIKNPTVTFTGSGIQQATVTVTTAAGCSVTSTTYVNVAAAPVITAPIATSVCSGNTYSSGVITSTGNAFDWSRAAVPNINGGVAAIGGTNVAKGVGFTEVLTNSSTSPIDVTYVLTPRSASSSCSGIPYNLVITVNPGSATPTLAAPVQPTCVIPHGSVVLNGLPATGTITQTGAVNTTYTISGGGTQTITNLSGGTYSFTVTISGGCASSPSTNIVINDPPATNTWTGSWSDGAPPTIDQRVIFNADYSSTTDVDACYCRVNNADVVFNSGHTLKVVNNVDVQVNGSLTFMNNASLVQINDDAINTGDIIYKRKTSPVNRYDFTYWSSPVAKQTLKLLSPNTLFDKYYRYDPDLGWKVVSYGALQMAKGEGYIIRAPQNYDISGNPLSFEANFIGIPNNGKVSKDIGKDKVYLLGNPYPSAINADTFLDLNSDLNVPEESRVLEGTLYFWTHNSPPSSDIAGNKKYNYAANDYALYNRTGGTRTAIADSEFNYPSGTNFDPPTGKIAAGQGFFAPAKAGGTLIFNNGMRISGGASGVDNSQFFKLSTSSKTTSAAVTMEKNRIWLNLTNSGGAFKQTLIGYITGATNDYEGSFDGVTYDGNQYIDFYSVNNAVNLAIQGRALPFVKKDTVTLGYKSTIKGDFQISIDSTDGVLATQDVFLEDKDLNILHDLKKEGYTFSTEKGVFNDRFVLRYVDKNAVEEVVEPEIPEVLNKEVLVSVKDGTITINSSVELLDTIIIYDAAGRKIYLKDKIDANTYVVPHLISSHQVLIVDILLADGTKLSRKIIY